MREETTEIDHPKPEAKAGLPGEGVQPRNRAYALDALRGIAILAMLLAGQLPSGERALPAWMYHAQNPPPNLQFNGLVYGITWVDLVFPFFLFCMGAAFPLAFARRMEKRTSAWKLALFILERGFLLAFFALYVMAIRPSELNPVPTTGTWLLGLLGFFLLFPILTRLPDKWPLALRLSVKGFGWAGAVLFLSLVRYSDGSGFELTRSDIIIVVLANMAVFGSTIWILTRNELLPRLGLIGILLAIRLSNMPAAWPGWVNDIWDYHPKMIERIYQLYYLQYLCIVIPGTVAGDLVLQWLRSSSEPPAQKNWPTPRMVGIAVLMVAFVLELLIGLKSRWLITTALATFAMCVLGWVLFLNPNSTTERLYRSLFLWGSYWLILGLFFESYEGGIRKGKPTISYYFVTSGLANCALIFFSIIIDVFRRRKWLQLFIDNGQNPMIAYAGINNFILPILALTGLDVALRKWATTPWLGFWQGVIVTLLMAVSVSVFTRCRIFWRT